MTSLFHHINKPTKLVTHELAMSRGDIELFRGISITLEAGNVLWMQGSNGIGKTTLLEALAGLSRPDKGDTRWMYNAVPCNPSDIIAYQAHKSSAKASLTAEEDLSFWAKLYGHKTQSADALHYVGLKEKASVATQKLSAGQKRRLALAKLIVSQKPIWIMDEPDAALDMVGTELIDTLVKAHIERGGSVIIASHNSPRHLSNNTLKLTLRTTA